MVGFSAANRKYTMAGTHSKAMILHTSVMSTRRVSAFAILSVGRDFISIPPFARILSRALLKVNDNLLIFNKTRGIKNRKTDGLSVVRFPFDIEKGEGENGVFRQAFTC